jgi:hypothetical protein
VLLAQAEAERALVFRLALAMGRQEAPVVEGAELLAPRLVVLETLVATRLLRVTRVGATITFLTRKALAMNTWVVAAAAVVVAA